MSPIFVADPNGSTPSGASVNKGVTAPVSSQVQSQAQTPSQSQPETQQPSQEAKPLNKRVIRRTGSSFTPSIKDALSGKMQEKQEESPKEKVKFYSGEQLNEPFTKEQFEEKWNFYLTRLDERPGLKSTLSKVPVIENGTKLKLMINNSLQNEDISTIKPDLVAWLRKELRNTQIELITEIEASEQSTQKAFTPSQRLQEMLQKNPNLKHLADKFGLSLEE